MIIAGSERRDIEPHKIYGEILIIRRRYIKKEAATMRL